MIEQGLFSYLSNVGPVRDLIQTPGDIVRLYPLIIPQGGKSPCVVYQFTGFTRSQTYCGTIRVLSCDLQLDSYATDYLDAVALAKTVRDALTDFRGIMGAVEVKQATLQTERDLEEPEPGLFRRWQDWQIWFVE